MKNLVVFCLCIVAFACQSTPENTEDSGAIYLAQGIMAGEASQNSIILQSRLTATDTLINGDVPGMAGVARFEISDNTNFSNPIVTEFIQAVPDHDFIVKFKVNSLEPATQYHYRLQYGLDQEHLVYSHSASFKTLASAERQEPVSMVVVTGMNYYHHYYGNYNSSEAYAGSDYALGFPAIPVILSLDPDYFVGTGDNVYFDHPNEKGFKNAMKAGKNPHPGGYDGKAATSEKDLRRKYHEQFSKPRFIDLFRETGTYWEKDDHDYRFNDADTAREYPVSHKLGIKNFREQLPVVDPSDPNDVTYRTRRMGKDLQVWFIEGRDYRSPNDMEPGPEKSLFGKEQKEWLKKTLQESDATYKFIISPTPFIGVDDAYKKDSHVNGPGFKYEGDEFFQWLEENGFLEKNLYFICGDRHWQYHARHPLGFEEFSTGALVDNNSRSGRVSGDPDSTDPDSLVHQFYVQGTKEEATGGFLFVKLIYEEDKPVMVFQHYDDEGKVLYEVLR